MTCLFLFLCRHVVGLSTEGRGLGGSSWGRSGGISAFMASCKSWLSFMISFAMSLKGVFLRKANAMRQEVFSQ